ncbi:MAG: hypothetical protein ACNA7H_04310 [Desulfotignum sp.]
MLVSLLVGILGVGTVYAQTWQVLETKYLRINYRNLEDLRQFDRQIKYRGDRRSGFSRFFSGTSRSSGSGGSFELQLADKVDSLFEKVQTILDMRKPIKVNVQLYRDQASIEEAYYMIFGNRRQLPAWYIFEFNTIYLNVQELFDGMFAHECAHAVVDNYFDVRPPRAAAEILARYVDINLNK